MSLKGFHDKYYSANVMSVSIMGNIDTKQIKQKIIPALSEIPNKKTSYMQKIKSDSEKLPSSIPQKYIGSWFLAKQKFAYDTFSMAFL